MASKLYGMFLSVAASAILLGASSLSHAASLVTLNGATVFQDDFENDTVRSEPTNPEVGTWTTTNVFTHVETATSQLTADPSGTPGTVIADAPTSAYQGNNFLRVYREDPITGGTIAAADIGAITSPVSGSSTLTATFAFYMPSSSGDFNAGISFSNNPNEPFGDALMYIDVGTQANGKIYFNNGAADIPITGVTYQQNVWQVWQINYTMLPGAHNDTYTVTIDGVTSDPVAATNSNGSGPDGATTTFHYLAFRGDGDGGFFVDAVPEPASLGLLTVGGLLLLRRRR